MELPYVMTCKKCGREFLSPSRKMKVCKRCKDNRPYENSTWFRNKKIAMERDGYICQCCGVSNESNKELDKLIVHHIDVNPRNHAISNLIVLCMQCHSSLHGKYKKKVLRRENIYKLFAKDFKFGKFGKTLIYGPGRKIVKKQFMGKVKFFKRKGKSLKEYSEYKLHQLKKMNED